jgi:hypothetical protein
VAGVTGCSAEPVVAPPDGATLDLQAPDTSRADLFLYWRHDVEVADAAPGTWSRSRRPSGAPGWGVPADHWDQVGQLFGDTPDKNNPFDHVRHYRDVAKFLVSRGF